MHRRCHFAVPLASHLIAALIVAFFIAGALPASAPKAEAAGSGSVTVRTYLCPDTISLVAVQNAPAPASLLADCDPFETGFAYPQLRAVPGGTPDPGDPFSPGVILWSDLPFGNYDFGGGNAPSGFGGLLITNGAGVPVADQEQAPVTIDSSVPNIERRFFFFTPDSAEVGAITLTFYRCPAAGDLSTTACTRYADPPIVTAGIFQPGWPEASLSGVQNGQATWPGIRLGEYTVGYGGITNIGEMAAIPELGCVSPDGCQVTIDAANPVANLEVFIYPLPSGTGYADHDGDGLTNNQESVLGTNSLAPDTDGDGANDGDEFNAGTDPRDPAEAP